MSPFSAIPRRANEAKSFEDLSRVAHEVETNKRLTKAERIVVEKAMENRRGYLARLSVTP